MYINTVLLRKPKVFLLYTQILYMASCRLLFAYKLDFL